jgi:adenine/guanine phosphoribosyltransferase-like PRPP-binding protein
MVLGLRNSSATSVIIVDVFRASGGSIDRVKEILKILNKRCGGAVVLVDFNPNDHDDVQSLYIWPYYKYLSINHSYDIASTS